MSIKRRLTTIITTIALVTASFAPSAAYATPTQELESARQTLASYGERLAEVQTRLVQSTERLNAIESEIVQRRNEADVTTVQLNEAQSALAEHMRDSYRAGNSSLLSVIVNAESFESMVSHVYVMDKISEQSSAEVNNIRDLQSSLAEQLTILEAQKQEQVEVNDETQREAAELNQRIAEAATYYNTLTSQVRSQLTAEARQRLAAAQGAGQTQVNQQGVVTDGMVNALATVDPNGMTVEPADTVVTDLTVLDMTPVGIPSTSYVPSYTGDDSRVAIIDQAVSCLNVPYVWGGKSMAGFDCSGLTTYCYEMSGIDVGGNRTTGALISWIQSRGNWKTNLDELLPGDMLFPSTGHVAIYLGGGMMIHAPYPGDVVRIASVYSFIGGGWAG